MNYEKCEYCNTVYDVEKFCKCPNCGAPLQNFPVEDEDIEETEYSEEEVFGVPSKRKLYALLSVGTIIFCIFFGLILFNQPNIEQTNIVQPNVVPYDYYVSVDNQGNYIVTTTDKSGFYNFSSSNASEAIQYAINKCPDGGTLQFTGDFNLNNTIIVDKPLNLSGYGSVFHSSVYPIMNITSTSRVSVAGFTIRGK